MRIVRSGTTLVELLVALLVTAVMASATFRLIDRTQRFAQGTALLADQRGQLAGAALALRASIESVASADSEFVAASDSAVAYYAPVGHAIACALTSSSVDLAPSALASAVSLTWWNTSPQPGDAIALFDDGAANGALDDRWMRAVVTAVTGLPNACQSTPFVDSIADAGKVGWRLTISSPVPTTVRRGAPVRISRVERFALYRSSGEWMLGWTEWNPRTATWNVIQPVAGPLLPYAPVGRPSGVQLTWLDSLGAVAAWSPGGPPFHSLMLRLYAPTRKLLRMDGAGVGFHHDSIRVRIPLRNAR